VTGDGYPRWISVLQEDLPSKSIWGVKLTRSHVEQGEMLSIYTPLLNKTDTYSAWTTLTGEGSLEPWEATVYRNSLETGLNSGNVPPNLPGSNKLVFPRSPRTRTHKNEKGPAPQAQLVKLEQQYLTLLSRSV